jgi:hypothetical protein
MIIIDYLCIIGTYYLLLFIIYDYLLLLLSMIISLLEPQVSKTNLQPSDWQIVQIWGVGEVLPGIDGAKDAKVVTIIQLQ